VNPITLWKLARKVNREVSLIQQATASYERTHDVSKSLFASKTFWFNLLTGAGELVQVATQTHIVPAGTVAVAAAVINIGLRFVTDQPVHVVDPQP
jgi:hypothetical protein